MHKQNKLLFRRLEKWLVLFKNKKYLLFIEKFVD
jgi:hypothetical protein